MDHQTDNRFGVIKFDILFKRTNEQNLALSCREGLLFVLPCAGAVDVNLVYGIIRYWCRGFVVIDLNSVVSTSLAESSEIHDINVMIYLL